MEAEKLAGEKKRKRKILDFRLIMLAILVVIVVLIWYQRNNQGEKQKEEVILPVTVTHAQFGDLSRVYTLNGYLESNDTVNLIPKTSGTLEELKVDVGDYVVKDEIIGHIESEQLKLSLNQAETAYLSSKSTYERQAQLFETRATSQKNYEQAKAAFESHQAQYELAKLQFDFSNLKAPISGVVLKIHADTGSLVSSRMPVLTIGTIEDLVLNASVPEHYYEYFLKRNGDMDVTLYRLERMDEPYKARVRYIAPVINSASMSFETVCEFIEPPEDLRPGMFMKVSFTLDTAEDVYYLPVETLSNGNSIWYVEPETEKAHNLELPVLFNNQEYIQIPAEYKDFLFIKEGFFFLHEGQKVRITQEDPS